MSSNFGGIPPLTSELAALEHLQNQTISLLALFTLAGNKDNYIVSNEFEIRPDPTMDCGVSCPWPIKKIFYTRKFKIFWWLAVRWAIVALWATCSWLLLIRYFLNLPVMRTYIIFWMSSNFIQIGTLTVELAALENLKSPHRFIMALRWATLSFGLLVIRSFLYLHVMRTCIKAWISLHFGQIPPLTTELASLEHLKSWHHHFF